MRILPHEILIRNLEGHFDEDHRLYRDREYAYIELKHMSGQDFGDDTEAWRKWFKSPEGRQHMRKPLSERHQK